MIDLSQLNISFIAGTLGQGGAERQLYYNLSALAKAGARIRLFTLTKGEFWESRLREIGIPISCIGGSESRLARLFALTRALQRDKPDLIQSQHFYTNLYAAMAGRLLGVRTIGAVRNDLSSEIRSIGRLMGYLSLKLPDVLAANSKASIRQAIEKGFPERKFHLLRNVVDTDHYAPQSEMNESEIIIAVIGRMVAQKRFDRMLSIIDRVRRSTSVPFRVLLAGDGPMRQEIRETAQKLGLHIEFSGTVIEPREIYDQASILLLTSDWEGTPNVVLEAMSSGLAVCATAVGDVPDIIRDEVTGFLANPEDEEKQVAALLKLLQNQTLRDEIGRRARSSIVDQFSLHHLPRKLQEFYKAVIQ